MNRCIPRFRWALIALIALSPVGCSKAPTPPVVEAQAPRGDSPEAALRLLEWCWNQRDMWRYAGLLSNDFVFEFAVPAAGDLGRVESWDRVDERTSVSNLLIGTVDRPAATNVRLTLDENFRVQADPRPGKNPTWHKAVVSNLVLSAHVDGVPAELVGATTFYLVRGDSASVPRKWVDRTIPASRLWFVERWEDGTGEVGALKAKYR